MKMPTLSPLAEMESLPHWRPSASRYGKSATPMSRSSPINAMKLTAMKRDRLATGRDRPTLTTSMRLFERRR